MIHFVDRHVGVRIRNCRWMLGITREELGRKAGLSATEVAGSEAGERPIVASSLWRIAVALDVSIGFLFEGIETAGACERDLRTAVLLEEEALQLLRAYHGLPSERRRDLLDHAQTLRDGTG